MVVTDEAEKKEAESIIIPQVHFVIALATCFLPVAYNPPGWQGIHGHLPNLDLINIMVDAIPHAQFESVRISKPAADTMSRCV